MREALQQTTTGGGPVGYTPLHFLCQASDHIYRKATLAERLLQSGAVDVNEFNYENDKVFAFFGAHPPLTKDPQPRTTCFQPSEGDMLPVISRVLLLFLWPQQLAKATSLKH